MTAAPPDTETRVQLALAVIQDHRRVRNVRACSADGCTWKPQRPGYASDPAATLRRHEQFNEHLARLIVDAVT